MTKNMLRPGIIPLLLALIVACDSLPEESQESSNSEIVVQEIELSGNVTDRNTEVSGLTWHNDELIILPQFANVLYSINRADILAYLDEDNIAIEADTIEFVVDGDLSIAGFQGYEAIIFSGDTAYLTIEANNRGTMASYLVSGLLTDSILTVDADSLISIPQPANVDNKGHESILLYNDLPMPLYEWNRYSEDNTDSFAILIDSEIEQIDFPVIPYRMTDATNVDENGRFWVISYHFPGSDTARVDGYTFDTYLEEGTHAIYEHVESLIELQINEDGSVTWLDNPPLFLELESDPRNWEGLARLDERNGFLLMTDKFPNTQLVFVELPENQ